MPGAGINRGALRAGKQIAALALLLLALCVVGRAFFFRGYTLRVPMTGPQRELLQQGEMRLQVERPEVASVGAPEGRQAVLTIPVTPGAAGETYIQLRDRDGEMLQVLALRVDRFHTVYDPQTGGFTGDTLVLWAVTVFWILVCCIMIWHYRQTRGPDYYSYATIYYAGFGIFSAGTAVLLLIQALRMVFDRDSFRMMEVYSAINGASRNFMLLTAPAVLLFALAMMVSNVVLLRHMTPRVQNVLGILIGVFLMAGEGLGFFLFFRDFSGSEWEWRLSNTLVNSYATAFAYFECLLAGSILCGIRAARHQPPPDRDFILILGCWFRKDGTLPPLLRGRADRAIAFWRWQKETTGKEAVLIPSGGQGPDESMPEAEAIRRYLVKQGIPEEKIRPECASANTYQNMAFSRKIIEDVAPEGRVAFATTNYHVFRSGVWAGEAGLRAEGMGGKTKWWFWPNAFMRECVALVQKRWLQEMLMLLAMIAWFALLSLALG